MSAFVHVPKWMCVFQFFYLVLDHLRFTLESRDSVGPCGFLVPRVLIFSFLLSFILLYSPSLSQPLAPSPNIAPLLFIQLKLSGSISSGLSVSRAWFSHSSCPLCQTKTEPCAKFIGTLSLNWPGLPVLRFVCLLENDLCICKISCDITKCLFLSQRLASAKAHTSRFVSANLPCNKFKNRLVNIMPYETTRVCLQPIRGVEGSDYINASFIDGYR